MRVSYPALAIAIAAVAHAEGLTTIPSCALNCIVTTFSTDGCSSLTDFSCHCSSLGVSDQITSCVESACSAADQATVSSTLQDTCANVGQPLAITDRSVVLPLARPVARAASGVSSAYSVASSIASGRNAVASSVGSSVASSVVSSIASRASAIGVVSSIGSSIGSVASSIPASVATATATSRTTTASSSTYTGAASIAKIAPGSLAGVVMAAAYLL